MSYWIRFTVLETQPCQTSVSCVNTYTNAHGSKQECIYICVNIVNNDTSHTPLVKPHQQGVPQNISIKFSTTMESVLDVKMCSCKSHFMVLRKR
jgi:hypothetical protein